MTQPLAFDSVSPRFGLPLLFAGQAQKEAHVNEALALADSLLHCAIEGSAANPPPSPVDGQCWLVTAGATGAWLGHDNALACRQAGNWLFVEPRDGLSVLNRDTGQTLHFRGSWQVPAAVAAATGGSMVDVEARQAIDGLIAALRTAGIFPEP